MTVLQRARGASKRTTREQDDGALHLFVRCEHWVIALSAELVERVAMPEDVVIGRADESRTDPARLPTIVCAERTWAACDLGLLLGLPAQEDAWVLTHWRDPDSGRPIALRTGSCLRMGRLATRLVTPLPQKLFEGPRTPIVGGFPLAAVGLPSSGHEAIGLSFDRSWDWR